VLVGLAPSRRLEIFSTLLVTSRPSVLLLVGVIASAVDNVLLLLVDQLLNAIEVDDSVIEVVSSPLLLSELVFPIEVGEGIGCSVVVDAAAAAADRNAFSSPAAFKAKTIPAWQCDVF
jgi:hypothetical protein